MLNEWKPTLFIKLKTIFEVKRFNKPIVTPIGKLAYNDPVKFQKYKLQVS
jgi:hypothetical protein